MKTLFFLSFLAILTFVSAPVYAANAQQAQVHQSQLDQASPQKPQAGQAPLGLAPATVAPGPLVAKIEVFKAERRLTTYDADDKLIHNYKIVLGWTPVGAKQEEGDGKTPEGSYIIDRRNENSAYNKSLHISYPSKEDIARAKKDKVSPGGAIFIHGKPNFKAWMFWRYNKSTDWTNGCIALDNVDINVLWDTVPDGTPVIIYP